MTLVEKMVYTDHGVSALHHPDTGQVCSLRVFLKFLSDVELEEVGGGWQMETQWVKRILCQHDDQSLSTAHTSLDGALCL